jgi:tetratricopeptide (TPR) repeat protein
VNAWDSLGEGYLASGMPARALEAFSGALALQATFGPSLLGRSLSLAALGRYDEALAAELPDFRIRAFLLSRVGRYKEATDVLDAGRREDDDAEVNANALLTSAWLAIERSEYSRALADVGAAQKALADRENHELLVLADLIGGMAEIRSGIVTQASARLTARKARDDGSNRVESNWVAAFEGELALAEQRYDAARASFKTAQRNAWLPLNRDASTVFANNLPSRDGMARIETARGNLAAAIAEYKRLTDIAIEDESSAVLEPRYVLELARLLEKTGDDAGSRATYRQFLELWKGADAGLPELAEARETSR